MLSTAIRSCSWSFVTKCLIVAITPVLWMPLTNAAAPSPAAVGSSDKLSKPRPPRGLRCILMHGPSRICAPFALASSPMSLPARIRRSWSNVEPRAVLPIIQHTFLLRAYCMTYPHGKQAAGTPLKNLVPRTPLGPSDVLRAGIPCSCRAFVCQKSTPAMDSSVHEYSTS